MEVRSSSKPEDSNARDGDGSNGGNGGNGGELLRGRGGVRGPG